MDAVTADARAAIAAFARFQSVFAATAADHGPTSSLEVRLHLAETAVGVARLGEDLNVLASLLDLRERVPTISAAAVEEMVAAGRALRS